VFYDVGAGGGGGGGTGGAVTAGDGDLATIGVTTDAAWSGTGAGSVVALLKNIALKLVSGVAVTVSSGSSTITNLLNPHPVSIADGVNVTQGAIADAAWNGVGSTTVIGALKSIRTLLSGGINVVSSGTVSVSNLLNPMPTSVANGANVTLGTTTDTVWNQGAGLGTAGTVVSLLKTISSWFYSGYVPTLWANTSPHVQWTTLLSPSPDITYGAVTTATSATGVQLNSGTSFPVSGILVQADEGNTASVYIQSGSGTTGGRISLAAGESIYLSVDNVNKVWIRAASGTQSVYWVSLSGGF
jgi:hypothetical protein